MKITNKVSLGVVLSVCQVIMLGLSYFVAFKIILNSLGEESLGVWTLVASVSSVANVANLGVSASLVKFVAIYHKKEEWQNINDMLSTGLMVVAGFMGLFIAALYASGSFILPFVIDQDKIQLALQLLPFSLASLWLNTIGSVYLSTLDGLLLTYIRNIIYIVSSVIFCVLTYFIVTVYGLMGVAYAQIIQILLIIIMANIALKINLPEFTTFRLKLRKDLFKEMFSYSAKFQMISILNLLVDPITKFFLAKFGSVSDVGYFEMANRLIIQTRQLVVTANQALIPSIAQKSESNAAIQEMYINIYRIVSFISMPLMGFLIILSPLISQLWIGHIELFFINSLFLLGFAYTININSAPAYFSFVGVGKLNKTITVFVVMGVLNISLSVLGGIWIGGMGVVIGWSIALAFASSLQIFLFRREFDLVPSQVYDKDFLRLVISYLFALIVSFIFLHVGLTDILSLSLTALFIFIIIIFLPNIRNGVFQQLLKRIKIK